MRNIALATKLIKQKWKHSEEGWMAEMHHCAVF